MVLVVESTLDALGGAYGYNRNEAPAYRFPICYRDSFEFSNREQLDHQVLIDVWLHNVSPTDNFSTNTQRG